MSETLILTPETMRKLRIYGEYKAYKDNNGNMEPIKVELSDSVKEKFNDLEMGFFRK